MTEQTRSTTHDGLAASSDAANGGTPGNLSGKREAPLRAGEAFTMIGGGLDGGLILLCDHASNTLPPEYGTLGLPQRELDRHIAYDIGAEAVTRGLAAALGAPAVMTRFSRLLIDCNRGADDPTLVMRLSDGAVVPGNRDIDDTERALRQARFYDPYHAAIAELLDQALAAGVVPAILSIHSFTAVWRGSPRPWHVGVLWDKDPRLARPLMNELARDGTLEVGDNEPYSGALKGDCLYRHGTSRGLPHAIVEIRQDLIGTVAGQEAWVARLSEIMCTILAPSYIAPDLHKVVDYGSRAR